jgi:zinc transport system substrate-binding protein
MSRTRSATPFGLTLAALTFVAPVAADAPSVVTSIAPIHSLVATIMDGVGTPTLLVEGGRSPHVYTLRPSEAATLQAAGVIFWIGPGMESFLVKPLDSLAGDAKVVALHKANGVTLLRYREGGIWADHDDHDHDHDAHGTAEADGDHDVHHDHDEDDATDAEAHHHGANPYDMHIWLDPTNARAMAATIVSTLSDADPANEARYAANGATLDKKLARLDADLAAQLSPIAEKPFIVFHDAYQYFENRYGLNAAGSITVDPDRKPGVQRLAEIRETIKDRGAVCVFSEPQFEPAVVRTVIEGTDARTGILDPLGSQLNAGPNAYSALMNDLATSLTDCLSPAR